MDRTERFYKIDMLLKEKSAVSLVCFMAAMEVSRSTVKRDIEYLRDRLNAPIIWDRTRMGYRYGTPAEGMPQYSLPGLWFNESELHALLSMEQRGHPWRGTTYSRTDWAEGLEVPTLAEKPDAEVLFWVGCTPALEQRSQAIARSMAKVLKAAKVDFAILGDEETCTGDPARRMGNEYLFQILAQQNIDTMNGYNVKKVVTICPHCFNTMKNEYPQLGGNFEVLHYSQFVDQLIKKGDIKPVKMMDITMGT